MFVARHYNVLGNKDRDPGSDVNVYMTGKDKHRGKEDGENGEKPGAEREREGGIQ